MRNLKRALSLALATVMTLGLMVVGTGAVGYDDVADTDNVEAIEVLQAVGIMTGDENGNFNPDNLVTRNEMAVVMSQLLNLDYNYYRGTNPFTDVPQWAAPYVAACAAEGVTSGIGDGLYGGDQNVTAAQAALMILKALGYFQYQADFEGDWQVTTIRQASYINLFDNIDASAEEALTRNQIAQLVLNGLKSNLVEFTGNVGATIGDVVIGHNTQYSARTNAASKYNTIDVGTTNIAENDQYYIQLGEELYDGDLELRDSTDPFGRPARMWEYDGEEIGTYVKTELLREEWTSGVSGRDLYDVLGSTVVDKYTVDIYFDGETEKNVVGTNNYFEIGDINRNNRSTLNSTGDGVLTQVYVDSTDELAVVSIINTYLAEATDDYDDRSDSLDLDVWGINEYSNTGAYFKHNDDDAEGFEVEGEDFAIEDAVDGDFFLVTVADGAIQTMEDVEILEGVTISSFSRGNYVKVDGTQYDYADTAEYKVGDLDEYDVSNLKDITYNVYLDQYGYLIGLEQVEEVNNYLFLTGIDGNASELGNRNADANVIFMDGTMDTVSVNLRDSSESLSDGTYDNYAVINTWCKYTVNNNGVYKLTEVGRTSNAVGQAHNGYDNLGNGTTYQINDTHYSLPDDNGKRVYTDDDTVFIHADTALIKGISVPTGSVIIDDVLSVVTGIENVNMTSFNGQGVLSDMKLTAGSDVSGWQNVSCGIYTLYDEEGRVTAAVILGEDQGTTKNLVYVNSSNVNTETDIEGNDYIWTRKVIFQGEEIEIQEKGDSLEWIGNDNSSDPTKDQGVVTSDTKWYQVYYDADGYVRKMEPASDALGGVWSSSNNDSCYITNITNVEPNLDNGDIILYEQTNLKDIGNVPYLGAGNRTLYINQDDTNGIRVSADVNTVLIQWNNNKKTTVYDSGRDSLDDIIDDLHKDAAGYDYYIAAVIEDGQATTIIFEDRNGDGYSSTTSNKHLSDATLSMGADSKLTAGCDIEGGYYASGFGMKVDFYRVIGDKEYFFNSNSYDGGTLNPYSAVSSTRAITEAGTYYAEISIYDLITKDVVDTITTPEIDVTP